MELNSEAIMGGVGWCYEEEDGGGEVFQSCVLCFVNVSWWDDE